MFLASVCTFQNASLSTSRMLTGLLSNNDLSIKRTFSNSPNSTLNEYQNFSKLRVNEPAKHVINVQVS